jgi:hypothetical protein
MYEKAVYYNGKKYRLHRRYFYCGGKTNRSLHRNIWSDANGEIPKGHHIHHKDGNRFNNDLSNLECVEGRKHIREHMIQRVKDNPEQFKKLAEIGRKEAPKWHASKEGKEWHKQNAIKCAFGKFEYGEKDCDVCNKTFKKLTSFARFCSNNCKSAFRRASKVDDIERTCVVCGDVYMVNKYTNRTNCLYCSTSRKVKKTLSKKDFVKFI